MTATVRLVALGLALDLERVETLERFREAMAELLDRHVEAHPTAPTLVSFPEHTGLLAAFLGEPGRAARQRLAAGGTAIDALGELAGGHAGALDHAAARFGEVDSLGALLQLALTDTLVRGIHETFGALAAERGLWLTVGAAMADWQVTRDPGALAAIAPAGDRAAVYVAASPEVRNRNLVYAPDGQLAAVQDKAYLVPMERDRDAGLGISACSVAEIGVADLPIGRLASVISKDAWMPDVNERLEQLGAEILVQPEAFDRWALVDRDDDIADLWPPDKLQRGGWWMLQRHRGLRANVTPMLLGRLGDLVFDGQPLVAVPTPGGRAPGLLGQPADGGWAAVGGFGGLGEPAARLADVGRRSDVEEWAQRRAAARAESSRLSEGAAWADVALPGRPVAARTREVAAPPSVEVASGAEVQLVPDLVSDGAQVRLAFISLGDDPAQGVLLTTGDGRAWTRPVALDPRPPRDADQFDRQWRPRLAVAGGEVVCLHLAFPHESWDLFAVRDGRPTVRVDDADDRDGVLRERGHDAPCLVADPRVPSRLIAVWSDLRWPWVLPQVRWASSEDAGASWSASRRVDAGALEGQPDPLLPRSPDETRGQTAPSAVIADGLLVVWQERDRDGWPTVWLVADAESGADTPRRLSPMGQAAYRPRVVAHGAQVWVVWEQDDAAGGGGLWWVHSSDGGQRFSAPAPLADDGRLQRDAGLVVLDAVAALVVVTEQSADGARVVAARLGAGTTGEPVRVSDTPVGADARAPSVARLGDHVVVAWQDTRAGTERVRTRAVPLAAVPAPRPGQRPGA